ncbi:MAG: hypothetical protein NTU53_23020 [Planctomycetota bacterium]|nr:hypothetical protein [Planctomycetota bacterium]
MSERWTLVFKAEGDGPPVEVRVRNLLKRALRTWGLRCTGFGPDTPSPASEPTVESVEVERRDTGNPPDESETL